MFGAARRTLLKSRDKVAKVRSCLGRHPLLTNVASYSAMCALAETSQQFLERQLEFRRDKKARDQDVESERVAKRRRYDWEAVARMVTVGGLLMAPSLHAWYKILDSRMVGTAWSMVAKKVALDLTVPTIPLYCIFYTGIWVCLHDVSNFTLICVYSSCSHELSGGQGGRVRGAVPEVLGHLRPVRVLLDAGAGLQLHGAAPEQEGRLRGRGHICRAQPPLPPQAIQTDDHRVILLYLIL